MTGQNETLVRYLSTLEAGTGPYPANLLLLGASSEGEPFVPVKVTSLEEARFFGEGELVDAFADVLQAGKPWAYLVRIGEAFSSDTERKEALRKAYHHLEDFPAHVVVPIGAKTGRGYAQDLAGFLGRRFPVGYGLGVLETPEIDPDNVKGSLSEILSAPELSGGLGDDGRVLCAVASPILVGGRPVRAQAFYGALLSTLPAAASPSNRSVPDGDVVWSLDEEDWEKLLSAGVTGWRKRPYRGLYTSTAQTLGTAPFRLQSTMRCLQAVLEMLEAVADVYVGRPVGGSGQEQALENDLKAALETARRRGYVRSFAVELDWRRAQGELEVFLELSLWHEIHEIRLRHSIQVS